MRETHKIMGVPLNTQVTVLTNKEVVMKKQYLLVLFLLVMALLAFGGLNEAIASGMLTYSFDDGHITTYTRALPILEKYGQVGTANVVLDLVQGRSGHPGDWMDSTQLIDLENRGWEICSHSITHPQFSKIPQRYSDEILSGWSKTSGASSTYQHAYTTYEQLRIVLEDNKRLERRYSVGSVDNHPGSFFFDKVNSSVYVHIRDSSDPSSHEMRSDSVERELEQSKVELTKLGLSIQNFVVPHSDWNEERRDLSTQYYNSVGVFYHNGYFNSIPADDPYWLARRYVGRTTTVEEVESWIEEAINENEWLILMLHYIGDPPEGCGWPAGYWSEENFESLVAWGNTQDIQVVTQQQGLTAVPIPPSFILFLSGLGIIFGTWIYKKSPYKNLRGTCMLKNLKA